MVEISEEETGAFVGLVEVVQADGFVACALTDIVGGAFTGLGTLEVGTFLTVLVEETPIPPRLIRVGSFDGQGMSGSFIPRRHKVARAEGLVAIHRSANMETLILDFISKECTD
jgi:hypothetical protein